MIDNISCYLDFSIIKVFRPIIYILARAFYSGEKKLNAKITCKCFLEGLLIILSPLQGSNEYFLLLIFQ